MILILDYKKGYRDENKKWHGSKSLLKCEKCNKEYIISKWNAINYKNKSNQCRSCANKKITPNNYKELAIIKNLTIKDKIPYKSNIKINWECNICKNIWNKSYNGLFWGDNNCPICNKTRHYIEKDYIELAKKFNKEYIGPFPQSSEIKTYWKCICEKISYQSYQCILRGQDCKKCAAIKRMGDKNGNWNPNKDYNRKQHDTYLYYKWVKIILEKYNYVCQKCGQIGGKLAGHHIFNWSKYKNLRYSLNNGICLCNNCHSNKNKTGFHSIYGLKNNNLFQIEEFIGRQLVEIDREKLLIKIKNNTTN